MRQLLPEPRDGLTDDDLTAAYAVPEGGHVRVNFVSSADGAVTVDGRSEGLSSPADKRVFGLLRDLADVVLVGAGTIRGEGYGYPRFGPERRARRRALGLAELPTFAIVSNSLNLDLSSSLFTDAPVRTVVLTAESAPADRRRAVAAVADVLTTGGAQADLASGLAALAGRGLRRVLSEGGPVLLGGLVGAGLLDELCLTLAPLLAGPGAGRIVAGAPHPPAGLALAGLLEEDGALFLRYAAEQAD